MARVCLVSLFVILSAMSVSAATVPFDAADLGSIGRDQAHGSDPGIWDIVCPPRYGARTELCPGRSRPELPVVTAGFAVPRIFAVSLAALVLAWFWVAVFQPRRRRHTKHRD